ncbi:MAG: hypothetical protein ABSG59_07035 [Verrucomicrobiota bacterium]
MSFSITTSSQTGNARGFVLACLGISAAVVLALALLNYVVDPYGAFGNNRLGVFISAEREAKPILLRRYQHDALLVGDSKMGMIPAGQLEGYRFFNASFAGASDEEEYFFLDHFATDQKLVVLEVDFLQCDPAVCSGDIFASRGMVSTLDSLLSAKTVEYSARTILEHLAGTPASLEPDGSGDASGWFKLYDRENKAVQRYKLERLFNYYDHVSPGFHLSFFGKIARLLRQRGVRCAAFVPPLHAALADHLKSSPNRQVFDRWRDEVRAIFPDVVDLSVSSYGEPKNFFQTDPVHFKPAVGVRLLNERVIPLAKDLMSTNSHSIGDAERK